MAIAAICRVTFGHAFHGATGGRLANLGIGWVVARSTYTPVFPLAGLMHPLSMVPIRKFLPGRSSPRRA
jgi:hypothetical protein